MTDTTPTPTARQRVFNRTALAMLILALALVGVSTAQAAYRLLLPADGWTYTQGTTVDEFSTNLLIFTDNLVGPPSPLHPGDRLLKLDGVTLAAAGSWTTPAISDRWHAGQPVRYTLVRDRQVVDVPVVLKHWTGAAVWRYAAGSPSLIAGWLGTLLMFGLALLVVLKRPREPAASALLLFAAVLLADHISTLVPDGPTTPASAVALLDAFFSYWTFALLIGPTLFALALLFPQPRRPLLRFPGLVVVPYVPIWLLVALFGYQPQIGWGLTAGFFALTLLTVIYTAVRLRDPASRAQMRWALGGIILAIALFVPLFVVTLGWVTPPATANTWVNEIVASVPSFSIAAVAAGFAVAILRYRLYDIDLIIRRTLIYGVLTVLLAAIYFGGVVVLQALLRPLTGAGNDLAVVGTTLLIAALALPLRRRVQTLIDQRFYRRKYDVARTLARFSAGLRDEVELDRLTGHLLAVVDETMRPTHVALWLRPPERKA